MAPAACFYSVACNQKEYNADLLVKNALVYTVDSNFTTAQAFVVVAGKLLPLAIAPHCLRSIMPAR